MLYREKMLDMAEDPRVAADLAGDHQAGEEAAAGGGGSPNPVVSSFPTAMLT